MPKLKFKLPEIETQNLSLICGPVNSNIEVEHFTMSLRLVSKSKDVKGDS